MKRLKEIVVDEYIKAINEMPDGCDGCAWPGDEGKEDDKKDKEVLLGKKVEEGKLLRWKIYVKGQSKPFVVGAESSNEAKQLAYQMIRNSSVKITKIVREHGDDIKEIDFKSQKAFQKYNAKHKMRKSTKVNIAGKETTAGAASKKGKKTGGDDEFDVGGPAHPNVPKGAKSSKDIGKPPQPSDFDGDMDKYLDALNQHMKDVEAKVDKDDDSTKAAKQANKKMEIDVLNKDADKGNGAQIDTENGTVTWTSGDPDEDTFFATNEDGEEIEVDYTDIVRFHNDNDSIMKNLNMESVNENLNEFNKAHFLNLIKQELDSLKGQIAYANDKVNYRGTEDWEKKEFKAVLKDLIKKYKDTEKHYKRVEKLKEGIIKEEKYVVASIYGDLYTPKAVSRNKADKLMMKLAKQYAGDNVFVLGVKYWNKPHKYNKKKIMAKEGTVSEGFDLKKLEDAIKVFQQKIAKQGNVTNARDEEHLKQLIKVYKQMGGRKIKEGKLTEMNEPWFEITYKDSRGRTKTDSMRAKNPNEAKKDFINLMKGRGFKVLKVVKEGTISEAKETIFDVAAKVMKDSQMYVYQSKRGKVKVDMQTANLLMKVFKKVNPKMKQILTKLGDDNPAQLVQTLWAVVKG